MREIRFDEEGKVRVDKYLKEITGLSRERIKNLIRNKKIFVNGKVIEPSYILQKGNLITIFEEEIDKEFNIEPEKGQLDIIYEDEDIIVLNKKAGILTHPTHAIKSGTLVNFLLYHTKLSNIGSPYRPGVVHRLDKETSGVIVFAKTDYAYWSLIEQFKNRIVKKTYYAIVEGRFPEKKKVVEFRVSPDRENPTKMKVHFLKGKDALTEIEVEKYVGNYTLLKIKPVTGRTHQIRLTLSYLGYPILGDDKYGKKTEIIKRVALHAYQISFLHPKTKQYVEFSAPFPEDLKKILTV
ncbi:MAG TPA: RluA family pseudouridine synthase [bacterium]|nr:RluA family pseudouridine synthase [bacterium]